VNKQIWATAGVAVAAIIVLTGCSGGQTPAAASATAAGPVTGTSTNIEPAPSIPTGTAAAAGVGQTQDGTQQGADSADVVAGKAAMALVSWDTATDKTETAAAVRAKPLMTAELAAKTVEPLRNSTQALWNQLAPLGARSEPKNEGTVVSEDSPEDTPTTVYRNYRMTWRWVKKDGSAVSVEDNRARNVYLSLVKVGDLWKVADYTTSDLPAK
jgi:hypothetical protein